jgi:uncharacterized membrane protein
LGVVETVPKRQQETAKSGHADQHFRGTPGRDAHGHQDRNALIGKIIASIGTFLIAWIFTQDIMIAAGISLADFMLRTVLNKLRERLWAKSAVEPASKEAVR